MPITDIIMQRLAAITQRLNTIATSSKNIEELPETTVINDDTKVLVSDNGVAKKYKLSNIQSNNKLRWYEFGDSIPGDGYITSENVALWLNSQNYALSISSESTPVVFVFYRYIDNVNVKFIYLFGRGKGIWGKANGAVTDETKWFYASDIKFFNATPVTIADLSTNAYAQIHDLGTVDDGDYIEAANALSWDLTTAGQGEPGETIVHFFSYIENGVTKILRFKGDPGFYGVDGDPFVESDFAPMTDSNVIPTPDINQVLTSGNSSGKKLILTDILGSLIEFGGKLISFRKGSKSTQVGFEEPTINTQLTIPAKPTDDVFAMISDINGMTLAANQASSEIYLKNASGAILATLNVAFLNNEGTTFHYNSETNELELINAQGEILSVIDVSAFVSNLIQHVSFNGSTPYVLEFKDAENNVVDSVSFAISNIQGLQAALDGKMSTSHPANAITSGNISNWNTAYDALDTFVDKTTDQSIAGKKSWNGLQEYNTLSSRIFVNLQSGTGLRTFYDVTSYSSSSASVSGAIQIILPLVSNSATMWVAELTVIEYSTLALGNELSPAKFIITGYGDYLTNLSVWCSHPNRFSKVKFGRNTSDDRTILIIEKYDNTFVRPKVTLDKVIYSYLDSNSALLQNPANYGINITTDVSSFVLSDTILNENFVRDNYYQSWVLANAVNRTTDQYAVNAIHGKKEWIGKQLITTRTIQKFGQNDNNFIRRLEYPSIYNPQSATVNGNIRIELPLTTSTMWSMKVTVIEYRSASPSNLLSPAEFIITGYGNNTVANKSVWCSNPDRFTQVRFGRNTADNASVIYIDKAESFQYPKVIIEYIDFHYTSSSIYDDAAFPITITTDNSNFVSNGTITNTDFVRDSFFLNNAVSNSYLKPSNTQIYGAGGESLNNLPIGSYIVALSTNATDKPFNSLGGLISVGALNGQGFQLLGSRLGSELWFRSFSTTYGAWIRLWNSGDFSAADVANWNAAYNHSQQSGNPHGTVIGDISGLQSSLNNKASLNADNTLTGNNEFTKPIVIAPAVNFDEAVNLQQLKENRPYSIYSVLLTQSGTSEPTAIVLQNDVAFSLTWSYVSVGVYRLNFGAVFPNDRCLVFSNIGTPGTITNTHEIRWTKPTDQNYIQVNTLTKVGSSNAAHSDGLLSKASFEVRFYY